MSARFRSPVRVLDNIVAAISAWRLERRTRIIVESLPRHLRKDIGWHDTDASMQQRDGWRL